MAYVLATNPPLPLIFFSCCITFVCLISFLKVSFGILQFVDLSVARQRGDGAYHDYLRSLLLDFLCFMLVANVTGLCVNDFLVC